MPADDLGGGTCRYCRRPFRIKKKNQQFCTPEHRKLFWKHGSLPFEKLWAQIENKIAAALGPLVSRIEVLELRAAGGHTNIANLNQEFNAGALALAELRSYQHEVATGRTEYARDVMEELEKRASVTHS